MKRYTYSESRLHRTVQRISDGGSNELFSRVPQIGVKFTALADHPGADPEETRRVEEMDLVSEIPGRNCTDEKTYMLGLRGSGPAS